MQEIKLTCVLLQLSSAPHPSASPTNLWGAHAARRGLLEPSSAALLLKETVNLVLVLKVQQLRRLIAVDALPVQQKSECIRADSLALRICIENFLHPGRLFDFEIGLLSRLRKQAQARRGEAGGSTGALGRALTWSFTRIVMVPSAAGFWSALSSAIVLLLREARGNDEGGRQPAAKHSRTRAARTPHLVLRCA